MQSVLVQRAVRVHGPEQQSIPHSWLIFDPGVALFIVHGGDSLGAVLAFEEERGLPALLDVTQVDQHGGYLHGKEAKQQDRWMMIWHRYTEK